MSNKHIEELLQQCIAAFDAGISPEECLSAFPAARAELEPLFRQAISLRVAFAASPRAEFRKRTRERVLFAAGRDVSAAFAARPDPEFVKDARQRFIRAAGADAQEALRAVPPPRLPFWMNTRRRLLEAAAASAPQPVARPMGGIFALRAGLAMSVAVFAMAVAALAYTLTIDNVPAGNAQLAQLESDLADIQQDRANGLQIDPTKLQNVTAQVNQLVQQPQQAPAVYEKLPDLISKQKEVINAAASEGLLAPELAQAQTQQLTAAAEKANELRLAAARAEEPTSTPQPAATNTAVPAAAAATKTPVPTTPIPVVTPPPPGEAVAAGQIRVTETTDTTGGKDWKNVELANMSFNIPDTWKLTGGIELDEGNYGFGVIDLDNLNIDTGSGATLRVNVKSGRIDVFMSGSQFALRVGGIETTNSLFISQEDLTAKAGALVADLRRVRDTFEPAGALVPPPPTATPTTTPTSTSTATPTSTPPATSSPAPSATP